MSKHTDPAAVKRLSRDYVCLCGTEVKVPPGYDADTDVTYSEVCATCPTCGEVTDFDGEPDCMPPCVTIYLDVFDEDGDVVDSTPADLTADDVQDVVAQAVAVVTAADNGVSDLWDYVADLREALESYSLIDPKS